MIDLSAVNNLFGLITLITFKTLLIMGLARFVGAVSSGKAFRTGLILAQGGEFGFVILTVAINNKLIEILARHTKQTFNKVRNDCEKETYMSAEEARRYGLVDKVVEPVKSIPSLIKRNKK